LRHELETGLAFDAQNTTFASFAQEYEKRKRERGEITQKTSSQYTYLIKLLTEQLGDAVITELDAGAIDHALTRIQNSHHLSNNTMRKVFMRLKAILHEATVYDLLIKNPCDKLKPAKRDESKRKSLSLKELASLMQALDELGDESALGIGIRLAATTGMRRGEILGLDWGAVELDEKRLRVKASYTKFNELKLPKSKAGIRTLALDADTVEHLRTYRLAQQKALSEWHITQEDSTPVITGQTGGRMNYDKFGDRIRRFFDQNGLQDYVLHELRHTQATLLLAANEDIKTVQTRLGHSQASLTLDLYGHAMPENDREAADIIGAIISGAKTGVRPAI